MARLTLEGTAYECGADETVLDALLRQGVEVPYSCRNGVCLTCVMRTDSPGVPGRARHDIRETLRHQGYFLPCVCVPQGDLALEFPHDASVYGRAVVAAVEALAPDIVRVALGAATPLYYHAGQFINLRRSDGLVRSYSLASVPSLDDGLILHVKYHSGGQMSGWIRDDLRAGEDVEFQGPNGDCFYVQGRGDQPMLLVGTSTGLAPLWGIARDALAAGHTGPIHLYHGSREADGLYLHEALADLARRHENFHYVPCVSGDAVEGRRPDRADRAALSDHRDLSGWRVFLCGAPPMVTGARKMAYLAGASMGDIHVDPYEIRDLRHESRD